MVHYWSPSCSCAACVLDLGPFCLLDCRLDCHLFTCCSQVLTCGTWPSLTFPTHHRWLVTWNQASPTSSASVPTMPLASVNLPPPQSMWPSPVSLVSWKIPSLLLFPHSPSSPDPSSPVSLVSWKLPSRMLFPQSWSLLPQWVWWVERFLLSCCSPIPPNPLQSWSLLPQWVWWVRRSCMPHIAAWMLIPMPPSPVSLVSWKIPSLLLLTYSPSNPDPSSPSEFGESEGPVCPILLVVYSSWSLLPQWVWWVRRSCMPHIARCILIMIPPPPVSLVSQKVLYAPYCSLYTHHDPSSPSEFGEWEQDQYEWFLKNLFSFLPELSEREDAPCVMWKTTYDNDFTDAGEIGKWVGH